MTTQSGGGGRQPLSPSGQKPKSTGELPVGSTPAEPQFVFCQHTAFTNIEPSNASYMGYDFIAPAVPAVGVTQIGTFAVPEQQVLDISEISFVVTRVLPGGLNMAALGDWFFLGTVSFTVDVSGVNPWDQFSIIPATASRTPGWFTINQNVLASWSDAPVHLLVMPRQTVTFNYAQQLPLSLIGGANPDGVIARVRGRWLEQSFYKRLAGRQV